MWENYYISELLVKYYVKMQRKKSNIKNTNWFLSLVTQIKYMNILLLYFVALILEH